MDKLTDYPIQKLESSTSDGLPRGVFLFPPLPSHSLVPCPVVAAQRRGKPIVLSGAEQAEPLRPVPGPEVPNRPVD